MIKRLKTTYQFQQPQNASTSFSQATACPPGRLLRITLYGIFNSENSTTSIFEDQWPVRVSQEQSLTEQDLLFTVKRIRNGYPVCYTAAIALRLAASSAQPAAVIAEALVTQILNQRAKLIRSNSDSLLPVEVLIGLSARATTAGYIQFGFSDAAIAHYFNSLIQFLPESHEIPTLSSLCFTLPQAEQRIFYLQHTHARCCSLLRLAQQQDLIHLNSQVPFNQTEHWQLIAPSSLTWLTATLQFQTNHETELQIVAHIITLLDALADWSAKFPKVLTASGEALKEINRLLTAAEKLSQAFHLSHRHWQLLGNLRTQPRDRLQAHLGLILICQRLLYYLLHHQLGIAAPFEL